jgi:phosphatidylglycerol:prolipoprotein diacylglycerol transferase
MKRAMAFFQQPVEWASLGLDPIALQLGGFALRWYSLAYIFGIIAAWVLLARMVRRPGSPMTAAHVDDLITWCTLGVILGGRTGYVLFYNPAQYAADPLAFFKLWEGGMSFHGGLAGVILAIFLYARSQGLSPLRILDYAAVVTPIGLLLGRLANFVNGELWGKATDVPWAIIFPTGGDIPRHPSQLYESALEGVVLFLILWLAFWKTRARYEPGKLVGIFLLGYGIARFGVEYVREADAQFEGSFLYTTIHMGQLLTLPMILGGIYFIATAKRRRVRVEGTAGTASIA